MAYNKKYSGKKNYSNNKPFTGKKTLLERDSVITFGKHNGKTVQDLLDDPETVGYLRWLSENVDRVELAEDVLAEL